MRQQHAMSFSWRTRLVAAIVLSLPLAAIASPTVDIFPNLAGVGIGVTPSYSGADDSIVGAVPGVRYQFKDSERFVEWYGPLADVNLLESSTWQLGPALGLRLGRSDVDDEVVKHLPEVDTTVEGGVMASYTYLNLNGIPWRFRAGVTAVTDLGNVYGGLNTSVFATYWMPLSRKVFVGIGGGGSVASASYNRAYYGVSDAGAAASGLPIYTPGSGLRQWYAWPAVIVQLSPHWAAGAGGFYQRLAGDAGDSPIVTERGSRDQFTYGVGLGYLW